jgi:hypothetical protein
MHWPDHNATGAMCEQGRGPSILFTYGTKKLLNLTPVGKVSGNFQGIGKRAGLKLVLVPARKYNTTVSFIKSFSDGCTQSATASGNQGYISHSGHFSNGYDLQG